MLHNMPKYIHSSAIALALVFFFCAQVFGYDLLAAYKGLKVAEGETGLYLLEKGEESLLARAWLANNARSSINVQYFIWSVDNIGVLAAEALLRAAERGVHVRVLVDDLLLDAPPESLIALADHPKIEIRIYNPVHKTGVSKVKRIFNFVTDFRNVNQRMHDKVFVVDDRFAITGGRNMADEYFDYNQKYNFRDRDILVVGGVVGEIQDNFESFWESEFAHPVESLLKFKKLFVNKRGIEKIQLELHKYAMDPTNFAPPVRKALFEIDDFVPAIIKSLVWTEARFVHDSPGKNEGMSGLSGGGLATESLVEVVQSAQERVTIQSPYLVMPAGALKLFRELVARGVDVRISTNSLGSTDNLAAFSGYRKQRDEILAAGVRIFEFKPHPEVQKELIARYPRLADNVPVFAIHAKTMVVDGKILYVGTFNLDPRSANLNTEVGILVENARLAGEVEARIDHDMKSVNSWQAGVENADSKAKFSKRFRLKFWNFLPLDSLL